MDTPLARPANLPLPQSYHPTTFLERGVAVPFTSPMLLGARARPGNRGGTELIVNNPAGGRGAYVLPWESVCELFQPTVYDRCLHEALSALPVITPGNIRQAARATADQGLAGREAAAAARATSLRDNEDQVLTNFLLLLELVSQAAPGAGIGRGSIDARRTAELEVRAKRTPDAVAPRLGLRPDQIAGELEELALLFSGVGAPGQNPTPRIVRLLTDLRRVRGEIQQFTQEIGDDYGGLVADVAELTISCARQTLAETHGLVKDMLLLLRQYRDGPTRTAERTARTEWLLDGWEQICALWLSAATDPERHEALTQMALMVPILPLEVCDWLGQVVDVKSAYRWRKEVPLNVDWRTGLLVERVALNEHRLARAA